MQDYEKKSSGTVFYHLLLNPSYRYIRHLLLWLALLMLAFNQVAVASENESIYIIWAFLTCCVFIFFLVVCYLNIYLLIPFFT